MRHDRIRSSRERANLTQEAFAELIDKDIKQIWRWENGKASPVADTLAQIAQVLHVSADYLLGLTHDSTAIVGVEMEPDEQQLLRLYRHLNLREKLVVINLTRYLDTDQQVTDMEDFMNKHNKQFD